MSVVFKRLALHLKHGVRWHCEAKKSYKCKLLVVGGGTGGCSVAWRFSRKMKKNCIIVLDPSKLHYYQPGFTLVAAGIRKLNQTVKPLPKLLPRSVLWLHDAAESFDPCQNLVYTCKGDKICYEFMVVAVGIKNDYDKIEGLQKALDDCYSRVTTIYSPCYCSKTWKLLQNFQGGHALFTFPIVGGKCAGAALKIMFLSHDYWRRRSEVSRKKEQYLGKETIKSISQGKPQSRQNKLIKKTNISYNTGAGRLFGIPKYTVALNKLVQDKSIVVNYCCNLVEVTPTDAVFQGINGQTINFPYNLLHVTPPMSPPACLVQCKALTNEAGFLDVDRHTLQHRRFPNVFGLGDCTCTPNIKTAAAVAPQSYVVEHNLSSFMAGTKLAVKYNGYGACPILTSYRRCILTEFNYDKKIWETFPFDQSKERCICYQVNKHIFPPLYWRRLIKGKWNGPAAIRRIINPFKM